MALKTCKTCGEPVKAVRTARGWQTIHTQTGNNYCLQKSYDSNRGHYRTDPERYAEYRMTAEYAAEVRSTFNPLD